MALGALIASVKWFRNKAFAGRYTFDTLADAREHPEERLINLNEGCGIDEEKSSLSPARPPLEIAHISELFVDKYSLVRYDSIGAKEDVILIGNPGRGKTHLAIGFGIAAV